MCHDVYKTGPLYDGIYAMEQITMEALCEMKICQIEQDLINHLQSFPISY